MTDAPPNPVPSMGVNDYADTLKRLQPRGRIWDAAPGSIMADLRTAQAALPAQFNARCADLSETESYPGTAVELLPMWEEAYGLPDPCTPLSPTTEQRQQALKARLAASGGLSRTSLIAVAAAFSYAVTITEFEPFRIGYASVASPLADLPWQSAWQINFPAGVTSEETTQVQCTLNRISPPYSTLIFNFI